MTSQPVAVWIITRHEPDGAVEHLAATTDKAEAHAVADALGEGHTAELTRPPAELGLPMLSPGGGHRVVAWWRCQAVVRAGVAEVGEPARLAGAARLLLPGEVLEAEERVRDDAQAAELERAVYGAEVYSGEALALSARRARDLAEQWARRVAGERGELA